MFNIFPYSDNHQLNLNWILRLFTTLKGGRTGQTLTKVGNGDYSWSWEDPAAGVASVNGQTGTVVLDADDVGAIPTPAGAAAGDHLIYDGNSWEATAYQPDEVVYFTYGSSTNSEIYAAYQAGKACLCIYNGYVYSLFNCTSTMAYFNFVNDDTSKNIECIANSWSNTSKILAAKADVHDIPTGGTAGQALTKIDGTDYNVQWQTISGGGAVDSVDGKTGTVTVLPIGGTADQVLAKVDGTNYNVYWKTISGGGGSQELYIAEYGTTTYAAIVAAAAAGQLVLLHELLSTTDYYIPLSAITSSEAVFYAARTSTIKIYQVNTSNTWSKPTTYLAETSSTTPTPGQVLRYSGGLWRPFKLIASGTITFSASWTNSGNGYYTQTVTVTGATVSSNSKVDLQLDTTTYATLNTAGTTMLFIENNAGTLTAYLYGTAPAASFTLDCTVTEVI